MLTLKYQIKGI